MNAGLYWSVERYALLAEGAVTATRSGTLAGCRGGVEVETQTAPNLAASRQRAIFAYARTTKLSSGDVTSWGWEIPDLSESWFTTSSGFTSDPSVRVELDDLKVFVTTTLGLYHWRVTFSEIRLYGQGTLLRTLGSGSVDGPWGLLTAPSVPLIGIPARVAAHASHNPQPPLWIGADGATTFDYTVDAAVTAGGWTYLQDGTWFEPEVLVSVEAIPALTCGVSPGTPSIGGTTIATMTATARAVFAQPATNHLIHEIGSSSVWACPNLVRSVERLGPEYAALVYRGALPATKRTASSICYTGYPPFGTLTTNSSETPVHANRDEILATVGGSAHALEDAFGDDLFAPYELDAVRSDWDLMGQYAAKTIRSSFGVDNVTDVTGHTFGYLRYTSDDLAWYVATICSPHWSTILWFPDESSSLWPVFGETATPGTYWFWQRQQFLTHPALPEDENVERRTDVMLEPLDESGLAGYVSSMVAPQDVSWWGVSRFKRRDLASVSGALVPTHASLWSAVGGSLSHGAAITVTANPGETLVTVDLDLLSFAVSPYGAMMLAETFAVSWSGASVAAVTASLVGWDGAETTLGTAPGTYSWPSTLAATKYAGTWAQEFGYLTFLTRDTGVDSGPSGISAALFADPRTAAFPRLLRARSARYLRFAVTLTSAGASMSLAYPTVTPRTSEPTVVPETAQVGDLLWADGPGGRFGSLKFDTDAPYAASVPDPWRVPKAWDWLCWENAFLRGLAAETDAAARIAALYDPAEGSTIEDVASDTLTVPVTKGSRSSALVINSWAECPPSIGCPNRDRDDALAETGTEAVLKTWSCCSRRRFLSSNSNALEQTDPLTATPIGATSGLFAVSGWHVWDHDLRLDNSEGPSHPIGAGDRLALASPWHGYLAIVFDRTGSSGPFYDVGPAFEHAWGYREDGTWYVEEGRGNVLPIPWDRVPQKITADWVRLARERASREGRRFLIVSDAGTVDLYRANDHGGRWTLATTLGSGSYPTVCSSDDGTIYCYWIDGTDLKGKLLDASFNVLKGPFVAKTGVDAGGIDCFVSRGSRGSSRVGLVWSEGGVAKIDFSDTGEF
ncbi:MAG: hypothetical protein KIS66_13900 [Fimbriimonadaceae bacterium]|nr:hypothetical protein [Fimbriimonadaceae bacterium]